MNAPLTGRITAVNTNPDRKHGLIKLDAPNDGVEVEFKPEALTDLEFGKHLVGQRVQCEVISGQPDRRAVNIQREGK